MLEEERSKKIIGLFYKVYNQLGYGFLEKVYQNSLCIELKNAGFSVKSQAAIKVFYNNAPVGDYFADIVVDDVIIIENKAMEALREEHEYQLQNYLRATNVEVGILFNFGRKPEFKRIIFTNDRKQL